MDQQEVQDNNTKKTKINVWRNELWDLVKTLIIFISLYFIVKTYVAQPFLVKGRSMETTFSDGDYLIVDQLTYNFNEPKRSEVVVFHTEFILGGKENEYYIKRVIGIPGDRVVIKDGKVTLYYNNSITPTSLEENYILEGLKTLSNEPIDIVLGQDQYFVMGDNRGNSSDSRYWGPVDRSYIIGRPIVRLFPFNKVRLLNSNTE
jgi:signal peptidase I